MRLIERGEALLLIATLLLICQPFLCAAVWHEDYDQAKELISDGKYEEAIYYLKGVLLKIPEPKTQKRYYGTTFKDYYPYYYLGLCYFNLGKYGLAVANFNNSEHAGAVQETEEIYRDLRRMRAEAEKRQKSSGDTSSVKKADTQPQTTTSTGKVDSTGTPATDALRARRAFRISRFLSDGKKLLRQGKLDQAGAKFDEVLKLDKNNREASDLKAQVAKTRRAKSLIAEGKKLEKKGNLQAALNKFNQARKNSPDDADLKKMISNVEGKIQAQKSRNEKKRRIADLLKSADGLFKKGKYESARKECDRVLQIDPKNASAQRLKRKIDDSVSAEIRAYRGPDREEKIKGFLSEAEKYIIEGDLALANGKLDNAEKFDNTNPKLVSLRSQLNKKNRERIKTGVEYYLNGNVKEAKEILKQAAEVTRSPSSLHALLGAIEYSQYLLDGSRNEKLVDSSKQYFRKVLENDKNFSLSKKVFSPRVIRYFEEIKKENK